MQVETDPTRLAEIIQKGVAQDLERMIRERLQAQVDPIISQMARDLANGMAVNVQGMKSYSTDDYATKTIINLMFNSKDVQYTAEAPGK
jgi:hypothetical protein